ncbi:MAG: energy transducer TonB [Bacteroidales bacterium]|nr:energy transducer TonB [Bacteroidales bacterium]
MESKKSKKADLENKKGLFLEIGLVFILALVLVAFNIKKSEQKKTDFSTETKTNDMEEIEFTEEQQEEEQQQPEEQQPEEPELSEDQVDIVDDNADIKNELDPKDQDENIPTGPSVIEGPTEDLVEEDAIEEVPDVDPTFPGGETALYKYLGSNIKYPELARNNNITGTVVVKFVVEKDGRVSNVSVLRDIGGGCGKEAMRVVGSMPKWTAGEKKGKKVRSFFTLPVQFELEG